MTRKLKLRGLLIGLIIVLAVTVALAQEGGTTPAETRVGDVTYLVQVGDVLERIAASYDVSVACLTEINAIPVNGNLLFPGNELTISASCPPYQGELPVENPRVEGAARALTLEGDYIVAVSDTLDTIAQAYNVSIISLFVVNGLDYGTPIFAGDTLILPTDGVPYGFYPGLSVGNPDGVDFYVVQAFDVLDLIAAYFGVDLQCLADANGLSDPNVLFPGFVVGIPANCPPYSGLSSRPVNPLRGAGIGASALMMDMSQIEPPTSEIISVTATPAAARPAGGQIVTATSQVTFQATETGFGIIIETPVGAGGAINRGPTVTPTPGS